MAVDIGAEAEDYASGTTGVTIINKTGQAIIAGEVTSIDIQCHTDLTNLRVGTFYVVSGNTLKCRDSEAIPGTITANSTVTKNVSITVAIGDYLGAYVPSGNIKLATEGGDGIWYKGGEYIDPNDETEYTFVASYKVALGGYITVPGWTGKISGVTNPAKIMGIAVANIKSVKGVE